MSAKKGTVLKVWGDGKLPSERLEEAQRAIPSWLGRITTDIVKHGYLRSDDPERNALVSGMALDINLALETLRVKSELLKPFLLENEGDIDREV